MLKIAAVIAAGVAGVLVLAAFQPGRFRIERSIVIDQPPERIVGLISDFHQWVAWSPYEKLDPGMKRTISGAPVGEGAVYEWEGNARAGKGRMEITAASASRVALQLEFIQPIAADNTAEFRLEPRGGGTEVTWSMDGPTPYIGKIMHLFVDMDRIVGRDFETGLANLKAAAESPEVSIIQE